MAHGAIVAVERKNKGGLGRVVSGRVGSGRVGSGRVGSGRVVSRSVQVEPGERCSLPDWTLASFFFRSAVTIAPLNGLFVLPAEGFEQAMLSHINCHKKSCDAEYY